MGQQHEKGHHDLSPARNLLCGYLFTVMIYFKNRSLSVLGPWVWSIYSLGRSRTMFRTMLVYMLKVGHKLFYSPDWDQDQHRTM